MDQSGAAWYHGQPITWKNYFKPGTNSVSSKSSPNVGNVKTICSSSSSSPPSSTSSRLEAFRVIRCCGWNDRINVWGSVFSAFLKIILPYINPALCVRVCRVVYLHYGYVWFNVLPVRVNNVFQPSNGFFRHVWLFVISVTTRYGRQVHVRHSIDIKGFDVIKVKLYLYRVKSDGTYKTNQLRMFHCVGRNSNF